MPAVIERLKQKPWIRHVLRAYERFSARLGSQFGAAITYFSVLAIVPILMFAFAIAGFVLTVARPELLYPIATAVADFFGQADTATRQKVLDLITSVLSNYTSIGVVGLLSALYSGAGWMGNLKNAFRVMSRTELDLKQAPGNIVVVTLVNLLQLVGLIVLIALTFGLASLSTSLADTVISAFGLADIPLIKPVLVVVPILISVGAGWLLFMYLFRVLPERHERWSVVRRGSLIAAIGLGVLQYAASFLIGRFTENKAFALFGPVIALMLFFNIFAQLILFTASWVATADHEAAGVPEEQVRFALVPEGGVDQQELAVAEHEVHAVRVESRIGFAAGTAIGAGLGAAVTYLLGRVRRRG